MMMVFQASFLSLSAGKYVFRGNVAQLASDYSKDMKALSSHIFKRFLIRMLVSGTDFPFLHVGVLNIENWANPVLRQ